MIFLTLLAILVTISQGLLVMTAPAILLESVTSDDNGNLPTEKVNYNELHKALYEANKLKASAISSQSIKRSNTIVLSSTDDTGVDSSAAFELFSPSYPAPDPIDSTKPTPAIATDHNDKQKRGADDKKPPANSSASPTPPASSSASPTPPANNTTNPTPPATNTTNPIPDPKKTPVTNSTTTVPQPTKTLATNTSSPITDPKKTPVSNSTTPVPQPTKTLATNTTNPVPDPKKTSTGNATAPTTTPTPDPKIPPVDEKAKKPTPANSATSLYCTMQKTKPLLQFNLMKNTHNCEMAGWTHLYSFISFNEKSNIAKTPWSFCTSTKGGFKSILQLKPTCATGQWKKNSAGYSTDLDTGHKLYAYLSKQGQMWMDPFKHLDEKDYSGMSVLNTVGILYAATQLEVDYMTGHIKRHPEQYVLEENEHTLGKDAMLGAQIALANLPVINATNNDTMHLKLPDLKKQLDLVGLGGFTNRYEFVQRGWVRDRDNTERHKIDLFYQDKTAHTWMCAITLPKGRVYAKPIIQSAFSTALHGHTVVKIEFASGRRLVMLPLPRPSRPPLPLYADEKFL